MNKIGRVDDGSLIFTDLSVPTPILVVAPETTGCRDEDTVVIRLVGERYLQMRLDRASCEAILKLLQDVLLKPVAKEN